MREIKFRGKSKNAWGGQSPVSCLVNDTGVYYGRGERAENGVEVIGNIHDNPALLDKSKDSDI